MWKKVNYKINNDLKLKETINLYDNDFYQCDSDEQNLVDKNIDVYLAIPTVNSVHNKTSRNNEFIDEEEVDDDEDDIEYDYDDFDYAYIDYDDIDYDDQKYHIYKSYVFYTYLFIFVKKHLIAKIKFDLEIELDSNPQNHRSFDSNDVKDKLLEYSKVLAKKYIEKNKENIKKGCQPVIDKLNLSNKKNVKADKTQVLKTDKTQVLKTDKTQVLKDISYYVLTKEEMISRYKKEIIISDSVMPNMINNIGIFE